MSFWQGKTVLITGHSGFKGGWLTLWLQSLGARVIGLSLPPESRPNLFELARIESGITSIFGDIRDFPKLLSIFETHRPEIVFHLAAQPLVRRSYADPIETYSTNVMGTVNLLEAVRKTGSVKSCVVITSDKCYENREWIWGYRENEAMGGFDPYSSSKGCAELVTSAYRNSFFGEDARVATARAGNVIGGGDFAADRLIPDMLRAIGENRNVLIRNPHAIRPWQHVLEPLAGYLLLAQQLHATGAAYAEPWNFGPSDHDAKPVNWIVERFTRHFEGAGWTLDEGRHPHEAHYLKLDCSKARTRLNWQPKWSLDQALEKIAAWHKAHLEGCDMREYTLQQINEYHQ